MVTLNETPVRTARNFNINNIKLDNINVPKELKTFENVEIFAESKKDIVTACNDSVQLKYGIGLEVENKNYESKIIVNSKMKNDINISFNFDKGNANLSEKILIEATENTKSNIIIRYVSRDDLEYFHNGIIKVIAKENSEVNVLYVNLLNTVSNNFISIENTILDNAKVNTCIVDFGGKNSISNYYSALEGKGAVNTLNTIYLGKENQVFDLNYIAELFGKKSNVNFEVQGALKDNSKKHFKGTIDFKRGSKKAVGNENEACMLLSDKARSIALPMLLCSEEDVEGNHSTSSGKVGERELFYIMSRGFSEAEAMKLMVRAKFNKILEQIKSEQIKNEIIYEIDKRLS